MIEEWRGGPREPCLNRACDPVVRPGACWSSADRLVPTAFAASPHGRVGVGGAWAPSPLSQCWLPQEGYGVCLLGKEHVLSCIFPGNEFLTRYLICRNLFPLHGLCYFPFLLVFFEAQFPLAAIHLLPLPNPVTPMVKLCKCRGATGPEGQGSSPSPTTCVHFPSPSEDDSAYRRVKVEDPYREVGLSFA